MLEIETFDARAGGNVIYKALAHPLAAEAIGRLLGSLEGPVALYDPDGIAEPLLALYPDLPGPGPLCPRHRSGRSAPAPASPPAR